MEQFLLNYFCIHIDEIAMSGEEKRKQLKELYKRELLARKDILAQAKKLRKMQRINDALSEINNAMNDDSDEWIRKLNEEAALSEAKMEIFLDEAHASVKETKIEDLAMEAEKARLSAEEMIKQLKREMGLLEEEEESTTDKSESNSSNTSTEQSQQPASNDDKLPPQKKTLGDF